MNVNLKRILIFITLFLLILPNNSTAISVGDVYDFEETYHYSMEFLEFEEAEITRTFRKSYRIEEIEGKYIKGRIFIFGTVNAFSFVLLDSSSYQNYSDFYHPALFCTPSGHHYLFWYWNETLYELYNSFENRTSSHSEFDFFFEVEGENHPVSYYKFIENDTRLYENCSFSYTMSIEYDEEGILKRYKTTFTAICDKFIKIEDQYIGRLNLHQTERTLFPFLVLSLSIIFIKIIIKRKKVRKNG